MQKLNLFIWLNFAAKENLAVKGVCLSPNVKCKIKLYFDFNIYRTVHEACQTLLHNLENKHTKQRASTRKNKNKKNKNKR